MWGHYGYSAGAHWIMSSLIDLLTECWMVNDTLLSDNDPVVPLVYLVHRLEILKISFMSTSLFDIGLISL